MKTLLTHALWLMLAIAGPLSCANAQEWKPTGAPHMQWWWCVASSSDGKILFAGRSWTNAGHYISTNSGAAWTSNNVPNSIYGSIRSVACSADGSRVIVAMENQGIFTSSNFGASWTLRSSAQGQSVASSADGTKLLAAGGDRILASTNSGLSWVVNPTPLICVWSVATSADGMNSIAAGYGTGVYVSTNAGFTWTQTSAPTTNWQAVASSADGSRLAVAGYGVICVSANSGETWQQCNLPAFNWHCLASAPDARRLLAGYQFGGATGHFYVSADSGNTWNRLSMPTNAPTAWDCPALTCCADGQIFIAAFASSSGDAPIYTYDWPLLPSPVLTIAKWGQGTVLLSWPSWATNFHLQQNVDLTANSWAAVTSSPMLVSNRLNGETFYELALPRTNNSSFYRLQIP